MDRALIACPDRPAADVIKSVLGDCHRIDVVWDAAACLEHFRQTRYDISFIDLDFLRGGDKSDYRQALLPYWEAFPSAEIILLTSPDTMRQAVRAVRAGASDFITYPVLEEGVRYALSSLRDSVLLQSELDYLRDEFWGGDAIEQVRSNSPVMRQAMKKVRLAAPTRTTVLLTGETGTGKGVLARLLHRHSNRCEQQFVSVHCGAIPDTLLESELFGHEKGAFTGANRRVLGKFEIASGGTIFLDEVGTLSSSAQIKLLQVLQDRTLQRVGSETSIAIDVRVIAATNVPLTQLCDAGLFRTDLYYRLNVFPVELPPLRERPEDIPLLTESLIKRLNRLLQRDIRGVHPAAMKVLRAYSWPGNVRELENLLERAFILETSSVLSPDSFPSELFGDAPGLAAPPAIDTGVTLEEFRRAAVDDLQRHYLKAQLTAHSGRINRTAEAAGISTRQLHKLMTRYQLHKEAYKDRLQAESDL